MGSGWSAQGSPDQLAALRAASLQQGDGAAKRKKSDITAGVGSNAATSPTGVAEYQNVKQLFLEAKTKGMSNEAFFQSMVNKTKDANSATEQESYTAPHAPGVSFTTTTATPMAAGADARHRWPTAINIDVENNKRSYSDVPSTEHMKRARRIRIFERGVDFADEARLNRLHISLDKSKAVFQPENRALIQAAMGKVFFTGGDSPQQGLQGAAFDRLLDSFEMVACAAGEWLMKEGEEGDNMYIVAEGSLQVLVGGEKVRDIGRGDAVGELALIYSAPRSASVRAAPAAAVLWSLCRDKFREVQAVTSSEALVARVEMLSAAPALEVVDRYALSLLGGAAEGVTLQAGETMVVEKDTIERCILVESGRLEISSSTTSSDAAIARLCGVPITQMAISPSTHTLVVQRGAFVGMPLLLCAGKGKRGAWTKAPARPGAPPDAFPGVVSPVTIKALEPTRVATFTVAQFETAAGPIREVFSQALQGRASVLKPMGIVDAIANTPQHERFEPDDFQLIKFLGTGSFGRVNLVCFKDPKRQESSPACRGIRLFALKAMAKRSVIGRDQLAHINDERRLLMSLDHPFIIKLFGAFQDRDSVFLLTEAVTAAELWSIVYEGTAGYKEGCLPITHGVFYAACVLEALAYMHGKGIAYRDLKPENIMMDAQGYLRIIDLGFAKQIPFVVHVWGKTEIHPKSYTMCGTPEYLAPEFIFNSGHDKGADYWAYGVLVYEFTAGHTPFQWPSEPMDMTALFTRIANCKREGVRFPKDFDRKTKGRPTRDLVSRLLQWEAPQRIGNLQAGADAVRAHAHFTGVDWAELLSKAARAPWVPTRKVGKDKVDEGVHKDVPAFTGNQALFADW